MDATLRSRLVSIDSLRAFAAIWVMVFHARGFFYRTESVASEQVFSVLNPLGLFDFLASQGSIAVSLFFVLSGFCVHLPFAGGKAFNLRSYISRRFYRIWPPYIVAVCLGLAMGVIAKWYDNESLFIVFAFHAFFWIWGLSPLSISDSALSPVFWSVVVEVQLYTFYALMQLIFGNRLLYFRMFVMMLFGIVYSYLASTAFHSVDVPNFFLPRVFALARLGEWLLGAALAQLFVCNPDLLIKNCNMSVLLCGVFVIVVTCLVKRGALFPIAYDQANSLGFALVTAYLIRCELCYGSCVGTSSREKRLVAWLSDRSYSLYLFHFPCLAMFGEFAIRLPWLNGYTKDSLGGTVIWFWVTTGGLALAFATTEMIYRLVEKPCHQFARCKFAS